MFKFSVNEIEFNSGESIELESDSLVILIGPNSAGKSTALREIKTSIYHPPNLKILRATTIEKKWDS